MQSRRSSYEAVTRTPTCGKVVLAFASSCDLESVAWWMTRLAGRVGSGRVEKSQKRSGGQVVWRQAARQNRLRVGSVLKLWRVLRVGSGRVTIFVDRVGSGKFDPQLCLEFLRTIHPLLSGAHHEREITRPARPPNSPKLFHNFFELSCGRTNQRRPTTQPTAHAKRNHYLLGMKVMILFVCAGVGRCSAHLFSSGVRTHNPTAPGPSLVTRTGANPVSVVCSGIPLCAWHSTGVSCRQPAAGIRVCRPSSSSLCRHDYAAGAANSSGNSWRPRLSGGRGAGVEQSVSTDQGRLVAAVFSTADKGPSVSAVVQLTSTSDYCHRFFLNLICKVPPATS